MTSVRLLVEERRRRILQLLDQQERATVEELAARFSVSPVTIRGDLDALADAGALVRSHGGALRRLEGQPDVPLSIKATRRREEKIRIGRAAAELVRENETIILDSGTTTLEIARQLRALRLPSITVITNGLNIALELASLPGTQVIMIGGLLRHVSYSTVGPQAEQMLRRFSADRLFLGVDGFDPEIGLTTPDPLEAQVNAVMIQVAREVTVVADSSKFQRRALSVIAGMEALRRLVTDTGADAALVAALRARDIEVVVV